jgi:hypothetical protein
MTLMDWPEYERITDLVDIYTGAKDDPANMTLGQLLGGDEKMMSVEKKQEREQRLAEARERRRRTIDRQEVNKYLASYGHLRSTGHFGIVNLVREQRGECEWWEGKIGATPKRVGELAAEGLSDRKLENRIKRFRGAVERMNVLARMMEERLESEAVIRRLK